MDTLVLKPLSTFDTTLASLTKSLTTTNTFTNAVALTNTLLQTDDSLTSALSTLHTHQRNYARILHLRAEAAALEQRLKDVIRTCERFRSEIETVHVGILEEEEEEEEEDDDDDGNAAGEVDYRDLLQLASRIATYNASAAREASSLLKSNGHSTDPGEVVNAAMNAEIAHDRAMKGMAFPAGEVLRMGALGRLQLLREQVGEEGVDKEVERIVRASEGGGTEDLLKMDMGGDEMDVPTSTTEVSRKAPARRQSATATRPTQTDSQAQERKKLSLDMWNEDDDDDDD